MITNITFEEFWVLEVLEVLETGDKKYFREVIAVL